MVSIAPPISLLTVVVLSKTWRLMVRSRARRRRQPSLTVCGQRQVVLLKGKDSASQASRQNPVTQASIAEVSTLPSDMNEKIAAVCSGSRVGARVGWKKGAAAVSVLSVEEVVPSVDMVLAIIRSGGGCVGVTKS
jgi:hypothetical protein